MRSSGCRWKNVAVFAAFAFAVLMMLHHLRNEYLGVGEGLMEIPTSTSKLLNRTIPVWKTAARACKARPVHLEAAWYKSQDGEDKELEKWFKDMCGGTYLEIGGLDGISFSNSYLYNKGLNWTGVLVEASPRNYEQLIKNRPNEIANVHAGVCEKKMNLHWVETPSGIRATGGFQEFAAPSFQKQ